MKLLLKQAAENVRPGGDRRRGLRRMRGGVPASAD